MLAFTIAVERWMKADNDEPFPLHAAAALSDLQVRAAELDSRRIRGRQVQLQPLAAAEMPGRDDLEVAAVEGGNFADVQTLGQRHHAGVHHLQPQ